MDSTREGGILEHECVIGVDCVGGNDWACAVVCVIGEGGEEEFDLRIMKMMKRRKKPRRISLRFGVFWNLAFMLLCRPAIM